MYAFVGNILVWTFENWELVLSSWAVCSLTTLFVIMQVLKKDGPLEEIKNDWPTILLISTFPPILVLGLIIAALIYTGDGISYIKRNLNLKHRLFKERSWWWNESTK